MQKSFKVALAITGLFTGSGLYAQEAGFNNFLLQSPSIVSPSQNYQVKQGRFEAYLGLLDGSIDSKGAAQAAGLGDEDISGTDLGLGGYYAIAPGTVLGLDVDYTNTKAGSLKTNATEITPSIAFSITPMFSLGLSAHLVSGSEDVRGGGNNNTDFNYFTIGATMHQDLWEATLVFNTESDHDNKPQNNSAQSWGLHGRYKFLPNLALGLSFYQKDTSALSSAVANAKDQTGYGLHLEAQFTEVFNGEFAFLGATDNDGASGADSTEFVAMGNYKLTPTVDIGARISYLTAKNDNFDTTGFRPNIFLTTYF